MTTERSDAYITEEDMEANFDRPADLEDLSHEAREALAKSNAEDLERRLHENCIHNGRTDLMPGLPHAVAVRFDPGAKTPQDLYVLLAELLQRFPRRPNTQDRMVSRSAPLDDVLVYVDGAATESKALCTVVFKPAQSDSSTLKSSRKRGLVFHLESRGPLGEPLPQTGDRAVLQAAIAAVDSCDWVSEGRVQLTLAADSAYLVEGITDYIGTWRQRGWRDSTGEPVANRDLWEKLLSQVNLHAHLGCEVRFWLITKSQNPCADEMAKHAPMNLEAEHARSLVVRAAK
jgi:ribonuclease HI